MWNCAKWVESQLSGEILFQCERYFWDEPFLFRECAYNIVRRCIPKVLMNDILDVCHAFPVGGHYGGIRKKPKVLQCRYLWLGPYRNANEFVRAYP